MKGGRDSHVHLNAQKNLFFYSILQEILLLNGYQNLSENLTKNKL